MAQVEQRHRGVGVIFGGGPLHTMGNPAVATDRLPDATVNETWVDGRRAWSADKASAC